MITTQNTTWGFHGTLETCGVADADALFDAAARTLMARFRLTADEARDLLDARIGRHLADALRPGEGGQDLIARLYAKKTWERDIRCAIRELRGDGPQRTAPTIPFRLNPEEVPVLRFALEHALSAISEAHAEDRAQLKALIERLEAAEKKGARA